MRTFKRHGALGVLTTVALSLGMAAAVGCGGSGDSADGGIEDGGSGFSFSGGIYQPTGDVTNLSDGCGLGPNDSGLGSSPVRSATYLINLSTAGTMDWYGNPDGTAKGTPPQPSNGTGTLAAGKAHLVRDNDILADNSSSCAYHLQVTNDVTLTGDNQFTSNYSTTETNHSGDCAASHTDGCVTTWTWALTKANAN